MEKWVLDISRYKKNARELAKRLTKWSNGLKNVRKIFVVCTGSGPGLMKAANWGASESKGRNIGQNIFFPMSRTTIFIFRGN